MSEAVILDISDKIFDPHSTKQKKFPRIYLISDILDKFRSPQKFDISEFYCMVTPSLCSAEYALSRTCELLHL